jgi:hypothetical protein
VLLRGKKKKGIIRKKGESKMRRMNRDFYSLMLFKICDERWNRDGEGESKMELIMKRNEEEPHA